MAMNDAMSRKIEALMDRRDELLISNMDWVRLTREIDAPDGVNYQTIRRIERGGTPRGKTLRVMEMALDLEEARREQDADTVARKAAIDNALSAVTGK